MSYPLVLCLTVLAKQYDIGLNIDARRNRLAGAVAGLCWSVWC